MAALERDPSLQSGGHYKVLFGKWQDDCNTPPPPDSQLTTPSLQEEVGINSSLLLTNTSPSTSKTHSTLLDLFLFYQVCIVQANTQNEPFGFTCRGKRLRVAGLGLMGANGVER